MATFTNLARANEIGANCYAIDLGEARIVLDAGMHPKLDGQASLPQLEKLDQTQVDALFLTHAHHDHTGAVPLLMERHPDARVFLTEPTYYLADRLLHNSVNVMKSQREELGIPEYPFYTHPQIASLTRRWQACRTGDRWTLEGFPSRLPDPVTFILHPAGHILGSAAVEINHRGRRILYTGDVNFFDQTLLRKASLPTSDIDTLVIETTRGAQPNPEGYSRDAVRDRLIQALNQVYDAGGSTLLPIFAMGKTQELLALLHEARQRGEIPHDTFFIGGLGRSFTEIYDRLADAPDRLSHKPSLTEDIRPQVLDWRTLRDFRPKRSHLYLLPSGMMTFRTTSNRFASAFLNREENGVFFVGYCDPDSPAGRLRATPRGEKIQLNPNEPETPVRARVEHFDFTSHATREVLLDYILQTAPRQCFLVHGDTPALAWFQNELARSAPSMKVIIPPPGEPIDF
ncbi:MAG: MBL fold metallo-hydrolase [Candidatus Methylacidiphilales bacterium]